MSKRCATSANLAHEHIFRPSLDPRWWRCACGEVEAEYEYPETFCLAEKDVTTYRLWRGRICHVGKRSGVNQPIYLCGSSLSAVYSSPHGAQKIEDMCLDCVRIYLKLQPQPRRRE